jgi:N-acetylglucosaminyl-diphospho-decaprenol L-rhamnosyltransferase
MAHAYLALSPVQSYSTVHPVRECDRGIPPRLSVVLVNYRQWQDTERLVRQLLSTGCVARGEAEIVIVDNHSPRHPALAGLRRCRGVSVRRWGRNRGFARAANEGGRLSRGGWLLLLNPDMSVPPEFLDRVLEAVERWSAEEPRAGILGFQLSHTDGSPQRSAGPFPTLAGTLARLVLPRAWRKYILRPGERSRPVPWVSGCCLLVRQECFADLGGFDRDFFLYYEDVDLCRRAWARGWSVWYEPALTLVHHQPLHTRRVPAHLRLVTRHALLTYADKHWPRWQARLLAGVVRGEAGCRRLLAWCRGDRAAADVFAELAAIAGDLAHARQRAARRRLQRVIRREEGRLGSGPVAGHPQSQPARPAAGLSRQRPPARAARHGRGGGG